jgi:hypothetical protein
MAPNRALAALLLLLGGGLLLGTASAARSLAASAAAEGLLHLEEASLRQLDCSSLLVRNDTQACTAFQTATLKAAIRQGAEHADNWKLWDSRQAREPEYGDDPGQTAACLLLLRASYPVSSSRARRWMLHKPCCTGCPADHATPSAGKSLAHTHTSIWQCYLH